MRPTQLGILFSLLLLTPTALKAESEEDRAALTYPFCKDEIGRRDNNLTHTPTNLRYGCHILRFYLDREDQNLNRALAAYNGSSGSLRYPNKVRTAWENHWRTAPLDW